MACVYAAGLDQMNVELGERIRDDTVIRINSSNVLLAPLASIGLHKNGLYQLN